MHTIYYYFNCLHYSIIISIGAALTAAVVFLVLMDPPEAELVPADPATESLLQMKFPIESKKTTIYVTFAILHRYFTKDY